MYSIQPLSLDHAPAMAVIAEDSHTHPMSQSSIESCFGRFYSSLGVFIKHDVLGEELVGFLILHQLFEDADVIDICLLPQQQGRGYGKALLQAGIAGLSRTEAQQLQLEVRVSNQAAIALYQRLGFVETGLRKNYYPAENEAGQEDALLMCLTLPTLISPSCK